MICVQVPRNIHLHAGRARQGKGQAALQTVLCHRDLGIR